MGDCFLTWISKKKAPPRGWGLSFWPVSDLSGPF